MVVTRPATSAAAHIAPPGLHRGAVGLRRRSSSTGVSRAGLLLAGHYHDPLTNGSWSDYAPEFVDLLAQTALADRRGPAPLVATGRDSQGRSASSCRAADDGHLAGGQATRILAWAIFAQVLGGVINAALQTGHYPTSQPNAAPS